MKRTTLAILAVTLAAAWPGASANAAQAEAVIASYADIAGASYADALAAARELDAAVEALLDAPSRATLDSARRAWLAARDPYQQTEVFRFGNPVVDAWEGRVNAWPLDEGLIDYVDAAYGRQSDANSLYAANVIASAALDIDGRTVDVTQITPELLAGSLHEAGGIEANVATGYHAIEFLLWGQDTNGTGPGAGQRPYTDFDLANCSNGNCDRRGRYLAAAVGLLVSDLEEMVASWDVAGEAREAVVSAGPADGLAIMLTGMGSLSYGELAGERMKLGLLLHDPEEEHDCFSDNTHNSHYYDALGIRNVYLGEYRRIDGRRVSGPSLSALVAERDAALDAEMRDRLDATMAAMDRLVERAGEGEAYDQMIGEGNAEGNAVVQAAIDALIAQSRTIEKIMAALDLGSVELEGSDSLDDPGSIFK